MRFSVALATGLACLALSSFASARSFRVEDLPNGARLGCVNCHGEAAAKTFNDFGSLALANLEGTGIPQQKHADWAGLCPTDPDQDGWTSGEELGDPDCVWKRGDPDPAGATWNPGVAASSPGSICDNGVLDATEECEGTMIAYTNCLELNYGTGELACKPDCTLDYSGCSLPPDGEEPTGDDDGSSTSGCAASPSPSAGSPIALVLGLVLASAAWRSRTSSSKKD